MQLSNGEKLILVMLSEVYKHLGIQGNINPELVLTSIFNNQTWGLEWEYSALFTDSEGNPPVVQETCDILDMYRTLTRSYDQLSAKEKKRVDDESAPFADFVKFQGFDGNHDPHISVVSHLVEQLGRYDELKGVVRNSHSRGTLGTYRRMLAVYGTMIDPFPHNGLTADQIIQILKR